MENSFSLSSEVFRFDRPVLINDKTFYSSLCSVFKLKIFFRKLLVIFLGGSKFINNA